MILFLTFLGCASASTVIFFAGRAWERTRADDATADTDLPARGSAHVDRPAPTSHRADSRYVPRQSTGSREVSRHNDGGRS
jgi:hypothetical protein